MTRREALTRIIRWMVNREVLYEDVLRRLLATETNVLVDIATSDLNVELFKELQRRGV